MWGQRVWDSAMEMRQRSNIEEDGSRSVTGDNVLMGQDRQL